VGGTKNGWEQGCIRCASLCYSPYIAPRFLTLRRVSLHRAAFPYTAPRFGDCRISFHRAAFPYTTPRFLTLCRVSLHRAAPRFGDCRVSLHHAAFPYTMPRCLTAIDAQSKFHLTKLNLTKPSQMPVIHFQIPTSHLSQNEYGRIDRSTHEPRNP
jgi:hypothetical protein